MQNKDMMKNLIARKSKADALSEDIRNRYADEYNAICMDLIEAISSDVDEIHERFIAALAENDIDTMCKMWLEVFGGQE